MTLQKIKDFDPNYRDYFDGHDVKNYDLYSNGEKVGSVDDLLVDERGKIRYLIINTGLWILGKKVLLPVGRSRIDFSNRRVTVDGLTREQVESLPEYDGTMPVDYDYEERVRGVYRPMGRSTMSGQGMGVGTPQESSAALEDSAPLESPTPLESDRTAFRDYDDRTIARDYDREPYTYDRDTYSYDRDPDLYNLSEGSHQNLRLYEERLIANKNRNKTGEVIVGKHVETETASVPVEVERERVVIDRTAPTNPMVGPDDASFQEGEVARVEVYEETPEVRKEAFVREEVRVRKEVDRQTTNAEETLRREELDVNTQGNPQVDQGNDPGRRSI
jgi:uncharacterized protein (TIGR02271 family)